MIGLVVMYSGRGVRVGERGREGEGEREERKAEEGKERGEQEGERREGKVEEGKERRRRGGSED